MIREFNPDTDKPAVIALIIELQDSEKSFDSRLPPGIKIAAAYYKWILRRCKKYAGKIFVAEEDSQVVGFITALGRLKYTDPDAYSHEYTLISELVVSEPYRNRGLGHQLLIKAEDYARQLGISSLQLEVTAANKTARRLYTASGFQEAWIQMEKKLG